jgi:N-acetylmuramoyl-L-alanine amidase
MITIAWYLLKVIICSGILCGYYYAALRNKIFHRWNRFYLLASIVLALAVPLMKINIFQKADADKGTVVRMLQTINYGDEIIIEYSRHNGLQFSSENLIAAAYLLVTIVFLSIFFVALYKIFRLKKKYPGTKIEGINFISTDARGTPFSFFNSIFWNNAIDLHSRPGQQIFNHEIAHVKEKHSYDKIFMNVVLLFFWINPFFWLMRKELSMIHEFIADKEALEDNDINVFAEMILQTVYPGQNFSITNNFFYSPLKRRIMMFTKNKNPKVNYISRLLVLPLIAIVFFAFTLKMKTITPANFYAGKKITVVIDAGHGGSDNGAIENNVHEKDLNLAIAKDVLAMNKNPNLVIILSREKDVDMPVKDRTDFTNEKKANLFISIHADVDANENDLSGLAIVIPKNDNPYLKESQLLGSAIIQSFQNNYPLPVSNDLQQLKQGVWVLKANECPSVLIETGFLSNQKDVDYLINPKNQQTIARNILSGIEKYAEQNESVIIYPVNAIPDTVPASTLQLKSKVPSNILFIVDGKIVPKKEAMAINPNDIQSVNVLKDEAAKKLYGEKGKNGVVIINKKSKEMPAVIFLDKIDKTKEPLYFLDGKEISEDQLRPLSPGSIESIKILKGENAIGIYGQKGKNGVILILSKHDDLNKLVSVRADANTNANSIHFNNEKNNNGKINSAFELNKNSNISNAKDSIPDKVFTKVENEAEFPGGKEAWSKYITSRIQKNQDQFTEKDFGTCLVKFIVNKDGSVSQVEATTMKNTELAKTSVEAIRTGPKWIPATQNDVVVTSYRLQPVTLSNPDKK